MEKLEDNLPASESGPYSRYWNICSPHQYLTVLKRATNQKLRLLKELEQLEVDTSQLRNQRTKDIHNRCQGLLKNSYSIKYIGVKDNQIGILSKRIKPDRNYQTNILPKMEEPYLVTGFFYPKRLKTISISKIKDETTLQNLQSSIKQSFPKHQKKEIDRSVKLRGSWNNLKCLGKSPTHLKFKQCRLPRVHENFSSYSRSLERAQFISEYLKTQS